MRRLYWMNETMTWFGGWRMGPFLFQIQFHRGVSKSLSQPVSRTRWYYFITMRFNSFHAINNPKPSWFSFSLFLWASYNCRCKFFGRFGILIGILKPISNSISPSFSLSLSFAQIYKPFIFWFDAPFEVTMSWLSGVYVIFTVSWICNDDSFFSRQSNFLLWIWISRNRI